MPGHEYPVPWVTAQKNLLPVGIEPGTSRSEVRLTNPLASRSGNARLYSDVKLKHLYLYSKRTFFSGWTSRWQSLKIWQFQSRSLPDNEESNDNEQCDHQANENADSQCVGHSASEEGCTHTDTHTHICTHARAHTHTNTLLQLTNVCNWATYKLTPLLMA